MVSEVDFHKYSSAFLSSGQRSRKERGLDSEKIRHFVYIHEVEKDTPDLTVRKVVSKGETYVTVKNAPHYCIAVVGLKDALGEFRSLRSRCVVSKTIITRNLKSLYLSSSSPFGRALTKAENLCAELNKACEH